MNRENIKKVRDHIEGLPAEQFDMSDWLKGTECGTCACIGGWTNKLFPPMRNGRVALYDDTAAGKTLGLDLTERRALFFPDDDVSDDITTAQAVAVLDHLLETGTVDWSVADKAAA